MATAGFQRISRSGAAIVFMGLDPGIRFFANIAPVSCVRV